MDIFAGSNTTGAVAERLRRRWLAFEIERKYLTASVLRFPYGGDDHILKLYFRTEAGEEGLAIHPERDDMAET